MDKFPIQKDPIAYLNQTFPPLILYNLLISFNLHILSVLGTVIDIDVQKILPKTGGSK